MYYTIESDKTLKYPYNIFNIVDINDLPYLFHYGETVSLVPCVFGENPGVEMFSSNWALNLPSDFFTSIQRIVTGPPPFIYENKSTPRKRIGEWADPKIFSYLAKKGMDIEKYAEHIAAAVCHKECLPLIRFRYKNYPDMITPIHDAYTEAGKPPPSLIRITMGLEDG